MQLIEHCLYISHWYLH